MSDDEVAAALRRLWGGGAPATWNRNRAAVGVLADLVRQPGNAGPHPQSPPTANGARNTPATRALPNAAIERLLSRRDIPLREKTLWRMLYETAART